MCAEFNSFDTKVPPANIVPEKPDMVTKNEVPLQKQRGTAVEEVDRLAAGSMRGENLTEEEFTERAQLIKKLRLAIDEGKSKNVPEGEIFDNRKLIALVEFLSATQAATINQITKNFTNERMYPRGRQVLKLRMREIGEMPDVLLFGWRGSAPDQGETKIHDHADSTVAIKVHEGEIQETVFHIQPSEWPNRKSGQVMKYTPPPKTKRYPEGAHKSYQSPYLHTVGGSPEKELSVTIHAYWRPSTHVAYDFKIEGEQLIEIGVS